MTAQAFDVEAPKLGPMASGFAPRAKSWVRSRRGFSASPAGIDDGSQRRPANVLVGPWAAAESTTHNEGVEYAARQVVDLLGRTNVQATTAVRFIRALRKIQAREYVFPHISVDEEGEINALWSADRMSLELSIPAEGDAYLRMTDAEGRELVVGFFPWLPVAETRNFLGELTRVVARSNPRWRSLFVS